MNTAALIAAASVLLGACAATAAPAPVAPPQAADPMIRDGVIAARLSIPDGDQPAIEAGFWVPTDEAAKPRPMIVISHGNGGDFRSHHDTAMALAKAGFVVVALTHTGDNWRDQSRATDLVGRTRQVSVVIDYMTRDWSARAGIDATRIGAFGFSAGGFTVLAAAGGDPDLGRLADHCRANPGFYDCRLIGQHAGTIKDGGAAPRLPHDARIKALAVAAPALGFTFTKESLSKVTQPVQLWQAGADQILPAPFYVEPVRDALPVAPEYRRIEGAAHFDFLPPCSPQLAAAAPMICKPTPGFDRAAFHETLNREVVRFFRQKLSH
ncbi:MULTISPECIES: prolyl oligopeptidase family serine peptidase [unclassified Brevundimonas]|uniref:alpha/beta hydrolase family protein n=1 Tax=unclassified Brevundimonas TaxID=2622653 RepID=UPI0025BC0455|nr:MULTISPECIES: prolyl oligopeptidase family serine peptidase [unclassified Brevundimonas]